MAAKKDVVYLSLYLDTAKAEKAYQTLITLQGELEAKLAEARKKATAGGVDPKEDPMVKMLDKQLKNIKSVSRQFNAANREIAKAATDMSQMATSAISSLIRNVEKRLDGLKGKARESAKANELREILANLKRERETRGVSAGYGLTMSGLEKELANTPKNIENLKRLLEHFKAFRDYTKSTRGREKANTFISQLEAEIKQMETAPLRNMRTVLSDLKAQLGGGGSIENLRALREELVRIQQTSKDSATVSKATGAISDIDQRIKSLTSLTTTAKQAEKDYKAAQKAIAQGDTARAETVRNLVTLMQQAQKAEGISVQTAQKYAQAERELSAMLKTSEQASMTKAQADQALATASHLAAQGEYASASAVRQTIEALKQAQQIEGLSIKQVQEYAAAQRNLEQQLNKAATTYMTAAQAEGVLHQGESARVVDINKAIESLKYLSQQETTTAAQAKQYAETIKKLTELTKPASTATKNFAYDQKFVADTLKNRTKVSIEELDRAIKMLEEEIRRSDRTMKDFANKQADLKKLKDEMAKVKGEANATSRAFQQQGDFITKAATKLMNYLGIFGGFYLVRQKLTEAFQANLKYDDSLTNIRKTTGLTAEAVEMLADNIKRIDTRSSLDEITNLAYAAGKLGVKGVSDVMAFTRAANQINIALGEQLNGAESVEQLMKIGELMGTNKELGIESSLLKVGSAINHLTMNSQAVAQPMVDFMRRTAGIATQAGITTSELTGLAGAVNALGQNVEMSATSISKMIVQMEKKPDGVAKALQMSAEETQHFKDMLSIGNAMDALLIVLQKTRELGGLSALAPVVKDLGSEGQRVIQTIATLSSNYEKVRDMVKMSNSAFEEGISVTREYNIKNENTAALWERIKNSLSKLMVSPEAVRYIREILLDLQKMPDAIEGLVRSMKPIGSMLLGVVKLFANFTSLFSGMAYAAFFRYMVSGFASMGNAVRNTVIAIKSFSLATTQAEIKAKGFFNYLKSAQFGNVFMVIATVVATIATSIWNAYREAKRFTEELEQGLRRTRAEMLAETRAIDDLKSRLQAAGEGTEEYKNIIQEINDKYGTLLNNILNEASGYDEVARALKAVNAELRMKALMDAKQKALTDHAQQNFEEQSELEDKLEDNIVRLLKRMKDVVGKDIDENGNEVGLTFKDLYENDDASAKNLVSNIMKGLMSVNAETGKTRISEFAESGEVSSRVMGYLQGFGFSTRLNTTNNDDFIDLARNAKNLNNKLIDNENKIDQINNRYNRVIAREAGESYQFYSQGASDKWTPISASVTQNGALQSFAGLQKEEIDAYKVVWAQERNKMQKQERLDKIDEVKAYLNWAEEDVATKRAYNLEANESADRKNWTEDYRTAFDQKQLAEAYLKILINAQGSVTDDDKANRKARSQAKEDYDNIIAKIKTFFEMQESEIHRMRLRGEITETEEERRKELNQQEQSRALASARFEVLGENKDGEWAKTLERMAEINIDQTQDLQDLLALIKGTDVRSIGKRLAQGTDGDTATLSGVRKEARTDMDKDLELSVKQAERVTAAWLAQNPMGKITKQFQVEFEQMDIMLADLKKYGAASLDEISETAMKAYRLVGSETEKYDVTTKEGLESFRAALMRTGILFEGALHASENTLRQVYYKSYEYAEQYEEQMKRLTDRTMRMWKKIYDASNTHQAHLQTQKDLEALIKTYNSLEKYGGSSRLDLVENVNLKKSKLNDAEDRYNNLAANANKHMDAAKALKANVGQKDENGVLITEKRADDEIASAQGELDALPEQYQAVTAAVNELIDAEFQLRDATLEWVSSMEGAFEKFMDGFVPFRSWYEDNGSLSANIFGTKEERQEAFGAFMDDVKKTVRESIMEHVRLRMTRAIQERLMTDDAKKQELARLIFKKAKKTEEVVFTQTADAAEKASNDAKTVASNANAMSAATTELTAKSGEVTGVVLANEAEAVSKSYAQLGPIAGSVAVGVLTAVIGAFLTMALNALGRGKSKGTAAAAPKTKLVSGMLTYDRGNVQSWAVRTYDSGNTVNYVQGDDGVYYAVQSRDITAKAPHGLVTRPTLTTVGGSPALIAENGPEMVIGRETTRAMQLNNPALFRAILAYDRNHSAGFVKTFDSGNAQTFSAEQIDSMTQDEMKQIIMGNQEALAQSAAVNAALVEQLSRGIHASFNVHGAGGALDVISQAAAEERRRGNTQYTKRLLG